MSGQTLILATLSGPKPILAPAGWEFDETAIIVWARLLQLTNESRRPFKRQRDKFVVAGQIEILAIILANALGMATPYWEQAALEFVEQGQ